MCQENERPYIAYGLKREGRTTGRWVEIGDAEAHRDGKGFSIFLDRLPTGGFSGRVLIRLKDARPASPGPVDDEDTFWSPQRP